MVCSHSSRKAVSTLCTVAVFMGGLYLAECFEVHNNGHGFNHYIACANGLLVSW